MSDKRGTDRTRRSVLKATAAAGAAAAATSVPGAAGSGHAVIDHPSVDYTASPVEIVESAGLLSTPGASRSLASGQQLAQRLAAEGIFEEATLDTLETGQLSRSRSEGIYHLSNGDVVNLGFRVQTDRGPVDVVYSAHSAPIAALWTDEKRVLFGPSPEGGYKKIETSLTDSTAGVDDVISAAECETNSDCRPDCDCEEIGCTGGTNRQSVCSSCVFGECQLTTGGCC